LNNDDKNSGEEIKQMARSEKYCGPKGPGGSNLVDFKVSWAYGTKNGLTGAKGWKSVEFKFK